MSDDGFWVGACERNVRERHDGLPRTYGDGGADIDRFFDALGDTRRRLLLMHLQHHGSADLDTLVEHLAEREGAELDAESVEKIRLDLHHCHLPKLSGYGLISYDSRTDTARREPLPVAVEKILDLARDLEDGD